MKMSSKPPSSPSVSACFQEELVNTIHGAFQVAVEITVQEVTKLLVQKMGDLRGKVTHTQRENDTLKQRLQEAEEQLEIFRAYMGGESSPSSGGPSRDPEPVHTSLTPLHDLSGSQDEMIIDLKTEPQVDPDGSEDGDSGTFREICADGRVLSQQYPSETSTLPDHDPQQEMSGVRKTDSAKRSCRDAALPPRPRDKEDNVSGTICPRGTEDNQSGTLQPKGTEDRSCSVQLVRIKVENASKEGMAADCCFDSMAVEDFGPDGLSSLVQSKMEDFGPDGLSLVQSKMEDFGPDSLSLVHSKMLEEWKPLEMLDTNVHSHHPEPVVPGPSRALTHPQDLPQLSGGSAPDFSSPGDFSNLLPPGDMAPTQASSSSVVYGVNVGAAGGRNHPPATGPIAPPPPSLHHAVVPPTSLHHHACKLCGQTFHAPSVLRRHYGQCQQHALQQQRQQLQHTARQQQATSASRPQGGSAPRRTKLQLYPPGCSPFRCTVCNRDFNRAENLKTHLRIHTGERPYTCSVCTKRFRHSGALKRHFRIHTGEKPYSCAQCGKTFRNCGGLKFHQRSHSRQREYGGNLH